MFLYTFVSGASISFPHLFLRSLNKVHRSSAVGHALIHPIFIHKILLYLGLDGFPSGEPIHVIAPIGATFLRQRAAQLRVAPSRLGGASSSGVLPLLSSTGTNVLYLCIFNSYLVFDGIFLLGGVLCLIGTLFVSCFKLLIDLYL